MRTLETILKIPDDKLKDDDHLDREDITGEEFEAALIEMRKKFSRRKELEPPKHDMAQATISAMKKI